MDLGLKGKGAIVTGGSLGIGSAIALELAREGANVAVSYRRHDAEANALVAQIEKMGPKALAVKADVSSYADAEGMVSRVAEAFGGLHLLVCNAGVTADGNRYRFGVDRNQRGSRTRIARVLHQHGVTPVEKHSLHT